MIYQIDGHCRRLLWVGQRRTEATLRRGLKALGPEVVKGLRFVCSDMWKPYLSVLATEAGQALHVLDRFHITMHLNQAVDQVRRAESTRLRAASKAAAQQLKHTRWTLLRRGSRVRGKARQKLQALLASKLQTARAWELKETFRAFLEIPLGDLGGSLSRLLDLAGDAQPSGTDEESRSHAAVARGADPELVPGQRRNLELAPWKVSTTRFEWSPDVLTVSARTKPWKSRFITRWDGFRNPSQPTDSAEEAKWEAATS